MKLSQLVLPTLTRVKTCGVSWRGRFTLTNGNLPANIKILESYSGYCSIFSDEEIQQIKINGLANCKSSFRIRSAFHINVVFINWQALQWDRFQVFVQNICLYWRDSVTLLMAGNLENPINYIKRSYPSRRVVCLAL